FHRYRFPQDQPAHVVFNTGAKLMGPVASSEVRRTSDSEVVGQVVMGPTARRPKPFTVYFVAQFNQPFAKFGGWQTGKLLADATEKVEGKDVGAYVSFAAPPREPLLMKVAISYISVGEARLNLDVELSHWDFDRVVRESREEWNQWLGRLEVEGGTESQRVKFYTDL